MAKLNIKPGDLIEWVYEYDSFLAVEGEELYSSIEKRYVPIGSNLVHMCIDIDDETYSWLNEKGLFHAHVDDNLLGTTATAARYHWKVVPRVCR